MKTADLNKIELSEYFCIEGLILPLLFIISGVRYIPGKAFDWTETYRRSKKVNDNYENAIRLAAHYDGVR